MGVLCCFARQKPCRDESVFSSRPMYFNHSWCVSFRPRPEDEQTHLPRKYTWAVLKRQTKSVMEGSTGHIEETNRDEEETTRDKREQRKGKKQWNFAHT